MRAMNHVFGFAAPAAGNTNRDIGIGNAARGWLRGWRMRFSATVDHTAVIPYLVDQVEASTTTATGTPPAEYIIASEGSTVIVPSATLITVERVFAQPMPFKNGLRLWMSLAGGTAVGSVQLEVFGDTE